MCNANEMQLMYWAALNNWSIMGLVFFRPNKTVFGYVGYMGTVGTEGICDTVLEQISNTAIHWILIVNYCISIHQL